MIEAVGTVRGEEVGFLKASKGYRYQVESKNEVDNWQASNWVGGTR
jgi:hypothetical protein